jgi:hypothetical protein
MMNLGNFDKTAILLGVAVLGLTTAKPATAGIIVNFENDPTGTSGEI